jgi:hypothetical protein
MKSHRIQLCASHRLFFREWVIAFETFSQSSRHLVPFPIRELRSSGCTTPGDAWLEQQRFDCSARQVYSSRPARAPRPGRRAATPEKPTLWSPEGHPLRLRPAAVADPAWARVAAVGRIGDAELPGRHVAVAACGVRLTTSPSTPRAARCWRRTQRFIWSATGPQDAARKRAG